MLGVRKYFWIWVLIVLSYLFTFATPLIASYFMFAKPVNASAGGALFYVTIATVSLAFLVKLFSIVHKMKISYAKVVLSLLATTVLAMTSKAFFEIVGTNFELLVDFVIVWYLGYLVGVIPKWFAIKIDREYLREIQVF